MKTATHFLGFQCRLKKNLPYTLGSSLNALIVYLKSCESFCNEMMVSTSTVEGVIEVYEILDSLSWLHGKGHNLSVRKESRKIVGVLFKK